MFVCSKDFQKNTTPEVKCMKINLRNGFLLIFTEKEIKKESMFPSVDKNKKFHTPRARLCYICGRQTLIAGFSHHVEGCSKLFLQREELKPPRERRHLPVDPMLSMGKGFDGSLNVGNNLDQINALSQQAYDATLSICQFCGRKFLPEKLVIHNRSCRADNPARRVDESVNRRQDTQPPNVPQPSFPSPTQYKSQGSSRQLLGNNNNNDYSNNNNNNSRSNTASTPSSNQSQRPNSSSGRGYNGNDSSIKGSSSSQNQSQYQDYGEDFTPAMMMQCPDCGRKFNEAAYEKHVKIGKKVFLEKRKAYDSQKHRIEGTDMATIQPTTRRGQQSSNNSSNNNNTMTSRSVKSAKHSTHQSNSAMPKWKADSESFRQAMKQARAVSLAQKKSQETGIPLSKLLPNKPSNPANDPTYAGYIQCPNCGRRFNETAGARHIPKCQDIINKPSRLKAHSGQQATTSTIASKYRR